MTFKDHTDPEKFLRHLTGKVAQYCERIEAGELNETVASFDILVAVFSAYDGGVGADEVKRALPIRAWREDTVEIPKALLRPIVEGWRAFRQEQETIPLGVAMGIEPKGKGHRPAHKRAETIEREQHLSNQVVLDLIASELEGGKISQDAAIAGVAEREGISYGTVQAAFKKRGKATIGKLGLGRVGN